MLTLKIKLHYFASKIGLFEDNSELQFRTSKYEWYFMEKRAEVGRCCSKWKSSGEKQEFKSDDGFSLAELLRYWISCRKCNVSLSLLGSVMNASFLLKILLLGFVTDKSSWDRYWVVLLSLLASQVHFSGFPLLIFTFPPFDQDLSLKVSLIKSGFFIFNGFFPLCQERPFLVSEGKGRAVRNKATFE